MVTQSVIHAKAVIRGATKLAVVLGAVQQHLRLVRCSCSFGGLANGVLVCRPFNISHNHESQTLSVFIFDVLRIILLAESELTAYQLVQRLDSMLFIFFYKY